jgi:hypothetical protein
MVAMWNLRSDKENIENMNNILNQYEKQFLADQDNETLQRRVATIVWFLKQSGFDLEYNN